MKRVPVDRDADLGTTIKTFFVNLIDRIDNLTAIGNVFYKEYREKFVLPLDRFGRDKGALVDPPVKGPDSKRSADANS